MNIKQDYPNELVINYPEDTILLGNIIKRYDKLIEDDAMTAYQLSKDSLQVYYRFCFIKYEMKKNSTRGKDAAIKEYLKEICEYLNMVSTQSRMNWKYAKENKKNNFED